MPRAGDGELDCLTDSSPLVVCGDRLEGTCPGLQTGATSRVTSVQRNNQLGCSDCSEISKVERERHVGVFGAVMDPARTISGPTLHR